MVILGGARSSGEAYAVTWVEAICRSLSRAGTYMKTRTNRGCALAEVKGIQSITEIRSVTCLTFAGTAGQFSSEKAGHRCLQPIRKALGHEKPHHRVPKKCEAAGVEHAHSHGRSQSVPGI